MSAGQSASERAAQLRREAAKLEQEARNYDQGSEGERHIGSILDRLPSDYVVFHDLRVPGHKANVDHLVVGPSGVFVIDAKKFSYAVTRGRGRGAAKLWTGKYPVDLQPCKWEAAEVESIVGVPVRSTMCIIAPGLPEPAFDFDGVRICQPNRVVAEVMKHSAGAIDVAQVSARVARAFDVQPEVRNPDRPVVRAARIAHSLSGNPLIRIMLVVAAAMISLPLVAPVSRWAGTVLSNAMLNDLAPTTVASTTPPATTITATTTTIPFPSPPAVPIQATCRNPGMGWVASFGWPGELPEGAAAYSIRWQLDGGPIVRHDFGGWSDPAQPQVEMLIPNGADQLFFTDYLDDAGQRLATTDQAFEVQGDC